MISFLATWDFFFLIATLYIYFEYTLNFFHIWSVICLSLLATPNFYLSFIFNVINFGVLHCTHPNWNYFGILNLSILSVLEYSQLPSFQTLLCPIFYLLSFCSSNYKDIRLLHFLLLMFFTLDLNSILLNFYSTRS